MYSHKDRVKNRKETPLNHMEQMTTYEVDARRTVEACCFHGNVFILVKVNTSVTAAEQLAGKKMTAINIVFFLLIHKDFIIGNECH